MVDRVRVVLQARTTSRRLPAKVLLPIGGIPLAVLCALRLRCTGLNVVLATSSDPTDDVLCHTAQKWGVAVTRGSLHDVLDRFLVCVEDLTDTDLVVRATADNPLPDGPFVDTLLTLFQATRRSYLGTSSPADGLPYGLSAEVFSVGALRQVARSAHDSADREHVTPSLRKQAGTDGVIRRGCFIANDVSHLRATVDTLDDYLAMALAFTRVEDPRTVAWQVLLSRLPSAGGGTRRVPAIGRGHEAYSVCMLGTAQLGLNYGVTNRSGRPDDEQAAGIVALATQAGITHVDTARAYGDAEARLGSLLGGTDALPLKVVTKLQPLDALPDDASEREVRTAVDASVYGSCRDLRRQQLDVLMFHRSADMHRWGGAAMARADEHRSSGVVAALGVSVYSPDEAIACVADERVTHLQIPFNLIDSRWLAGDFTQALSRRPDVRVHVRSVFLQGLLLHGPECWPSWFEGRDDLVDRIGSLATTLGRKSAADLCMAYVRSFEWVTTIVLGVETAVQLEELIALCAEPVLAADQVAAVHSRIAGIPERLLNPARW